MFYFKLIYKKFIRPGYVTLVPNQSLRFQEETSILKIKKVAAMNLFERQIGNSETKFSLLSCVFIDR